MPTRYITGRMQDFVHVGSDIGQLLWIVLLNGRERWNVDGNGNRSILISQGGVEGGRHYTCLCICTI